MPPTHCPSCGTSQDFVFDAQAGGLACHSCGAVVEDFEVLGRDDEGGTSAGRASLRIGADSVQSRQARLVAAQTDNSQNRTDYARRKEHEWDAWIRGVLNACGLGALLPRVQLKFRECRTYAARKQAEQDEMDERGELVAEHERVGEITWGRQAELYGLGCGYIAAVQAKSDLTLHHLLSRADRPATDAPLVERAITTICRWLGPAEVEFGPELLLDRIHKYTHDTLQLKKPKLLGSSATDWSKGSVKWARSADLKQAKAFAGDLIRLGRDVSLNKGREPEQVAVAAFVIGIEAVAREKAPSLANWFDHLSHAFGGKAFTMAERYREFESFLLDKVAEYPFVVPGQAPAKARRKRVEVHLFAALLVKLLATNARRSSTVGTQMTQQHIDNAYAQPSLRPFVSTADATNDDSTNQDSADLDSSTPGPSPPLPGRLSTLFENRWLDRHGKRPAKYMRERAGPLKRARLLDDLVGRSDSESPDDRPTQSPSPSENSVSTSHDAARVELGGSRQLKQVLPHEAVADEMVRQLLQGHDATAVLEGKAALEDARATRLERLIVARGGRAGGDVFDRLVDDDELFDEGELDGLIRTDDEAASFASTARWRDIEAHHREYVGPAKERVKREGTGSRRRGAGGRGSLAPVVRKSKVTAAMKAFAEQLLRGDGDGEDGGAEVADFGQFQAMVASGDEGEGEEEEEDEKEEDAEGEGVEGMDGDALAAYAQARWGYGGEDD